MLNLAQSMFLLAVNDDNGKLVPSTSLRYGLIGAVLIDLVLCGKLALEEGKKLQVLDSTPTGDPILDKELEKIIKAGRIKKVSSWVNNLGQRTLRKQVAESLIHRGALRKADDRYWWIIPSEVFPEQNSSAKFVVKERLRATVLAGEDPTPESLAMLRLLHACWLLNLIFTKDERKAAGKQAELLLKGNGFERKLALAVEEIASAVEENSRKAGAER